jgi:hypothetical protein
VSLEWYLYIFTGEPPVLRTSASPFPQELHKSPCAPQPLQASDSTAGFLVRRAGALERVWEVSFSSPGDCGRARIYPCRRKGQSGARPLGSRLGGTTPSAAKAGPFTATRTARLKACRSAVLTQSLWAWLRQAGQPARGRHHQISVADLMVRLPFDRLRAPSLPAQAGEVEGKRAACFTAHSARYYTAPVMRCYL